MPTPAPSPAPIDPDLLKKAKLALDRAKASLMLNRDAAFFTSVVFSMRHVFDDSIQTVCTNGLVCRYNPVFFLALPEKQRVFVIVHEAMHPAYLHMLRMGDRNHELWNDACDHTINLQLLGRGFEMPEWVLKDDRFKSLCAEQVYDILKRESWANPPCIQPGMGQGRDRNRDLEPPPASPEAQAKIEQEVKQILVRAQIRAKEEGEKAAGNIPAELQVMLDGILSPKLPWHRILSKYLHVMVGRNDYSMSRPNRRHLPEFYLPSLRSPSLDHVAAFVDISSSVTDADFHQQISEIAAIFKMMRPRKITLILFNTRIVSVHEVKSFKELMAVQFKGRGGTRIDECLEWINDKKPTLSLVLSDGGFSFPDGVVCASPVFWVIYDDEDFTPPFGRTVHYAINN